MAQNYQQHEGGCLGEIQEVFLQEVASELAVGVGFFQTGKGREHGLNKQKEVGPSLAWFRNGQM